MEPPGIIGWGKTAKYPKKELIGVKSPSTVSQRQTAKHKK